jgi:hypothetical protein
VYFQRRAATIMNVPSTNVGFSNNTITIVVTITTWIIPSLLLLVSIRGSYIIGNSMQLPQKYTSNSLLDRSGGILYRTSIISCKEEWDMIYREVVGLLPYLQPESKSSIAQHRLGIALTSQTSPTVQLLRHPNSSITKYINRIAAVTTTNTDPSLLLPIIPYVLAPDIPVEIRSYETRNANMNWHIDDVLYQPIPQIEIILTIINTSNCQTMWQLGTGTTTTSTTTNNIETEPNSILCLRAGVTSHCVTPLQYGKRIILKCAYIPSGSATTWINQRSNTATTNTSQFHSISAKQRKKTNGIFLSSKSQHRRKK